jgi:protein arginine kinase
MNVDEFLKPTGKQASITLEAGTAVSSRIRLARNIKDAAFPGWAGEEECTRIWEQLSGALPSLKSMKPALAVAMNDLSALDRQLLLERHLISLEQSEKGQGSGLVVRQDERIAVMVNEEDHLRMQAIRPGLSLQRAWEDLDQVDSEIETVVRYAFSPTLGYLTACPTNVGTGIRASVMLHLPALVLLEEINPIIKGMGKIGLAVRGLWGEGTEAIGNLFQISNQITLGEPENKIISDLEQIVQEIVEHEQNACVRLMERRRTAVMDHVGRAYGVLTHAHVLTSREALDLLSALSLGLDLGILKPVDRRVVDELLLLTQPGYLQKMEGRALKPKERDEARADLVRSRLASSTPKRRKSPKDRNKDE